MRLMISRQRPGLEDDIQVRNTIGRHHIPSQCAVSTTRSQPSYFSRRAFGGRVYRLGAADAAALGGGVTGFVSLVSRENTGVVRAVRCGVLLL